ncbi:MAG TPA: isoprenyl transferase [Bacteroidales bacterium]|nr:isoprenyl transferase [Bacteroidales bacterium]
MSLKDSINLDKVPIHIAIIMDGNGRWAKKYGKERSYGHEQGVIAVREAAEASAEIGVKYLTLYAFSKENWKRPKEEIQALMALLVKAIKNEKHTLNKNNIRLLAIGDLLSLPKECYNDLMEAIEETSSNTGMSLNLALSYSSRWEIVDAVKKIAILVKNNKLNIEDINEDVLCENLNSYGIPFPELLIRTSGELRLSNFLLWQIAYTELYFTNTLWPDFRKEDLYKAVVEFQKRERRFGMTSEQLI